MRVRIILSLLFVVALAPATLAIDFSGNEGKPCPEVSVKDAAPAWGKAKAR